MFLVHGMTKFQQHWLFWTDISLYSEADSGVLDSTVYLRVLWSMMLAGWATAAKRTAVAMYFGKRTYGEFKPRLESILKDIILLSEVSELAQEAVADNAKCNGGKEVKLIGDVDWDVTRSRSFVDRAVSEELTDDEDSADMDASSTECSGEGGFSSQGILRTNSVGSLRAKDLLDHWEEPVNKMDKVSFIGYCECILTPAERTVTHSIHSHFASSPRMPPFMTFLGFGGHSHSWMMLVPLGRTLGLLHHAMR